VLEKVIDGVGWIPGRDRFLPDSHMYVIGKPGYGDFTLVDCGLMDMGAYKIEALEQAGIPLNEVRRVIMTHSHLDHIGCLPELLEVMPHMEVWVHSHEAVYLEQGDERVVFGNKMFESMVRSQFTIAEHHFRMTVHRKLEGGESLSLGGLAFQVIHLPGHSAGSIGLFQPDTRLFMSGDTIYADGAIGRYDLFTADPGELRSSLERIGSLGVEILLPCHNRIVKAGAGPMIRNTVRQWAPLLAS
jgi:hydroxyacylglutathione hydrolase